jgi:hypothetical protein
MWGVAGSWILRAMSAPVSPTIRVHHRWRGGWEVAVPGSSEEVTCPTLTAAREAAYRAAAGHTPCTVIVRDAYHRVLARELVDSRR